MKLEFTKMHGAGNDYIYIDCFRTEIKDPSALAVRLSPRHVSVGSDGVILVLPSDKADGRMRIFNADGSEGRMCGNGIRCVAKLLYDRGYARKDVMDIETESGIKHIRVLTENGVCTGASVDMGRASFVPEEIPVVSETPEISFGGRTFVCVSMGNPHAVTFTDSIDNLDIETTGTALQKSSLFPESVNVEFCEMTQSGMKMRVWERGSGETYACGTGTCAAVAAAVRTGRLPADTDNTVKVLGGRLTINCSKDYLVTMTGEAVRVYEGITEVE